MTENFYEGELSPKTRRVILKHKQHEAQSSKWDYLHHRPPFEEQTHFNQCRLTDIEWQYDKDRFSNPLWAHYKTEKYKTLCAMGLGIYSSRTPNKYRGSSPSSAFMQRRARSSSLGERRASLSPQKEKKYLKQSFFDFAERRNERKPFFEDSYTTPRKKSFGEHFNTLPDERLPSEARETSPIKKNSAIRFTTESPNSSPSKKKPPISPLKSTGRTATYKVQSWREYNSYQKSKSGESEDFRNSALQQQQVSSINEAPQKSLNSSANQNRKTKFSPIRSYGKNELRETASFRTQDLHQQTEPDDFQNCPQPEPLLSTPIRESLETTPNQSRRSRKDRKKIKEEKSQTPSLTSEVFESQTEKEITTPKSPVKFSEATPLENQLLSNNNNQDSKAKERRSRRERNKNESEGEIDGWSVDIDVLSNSSLGGEAGGNSQSSSLARLNNDPEKLIVPSPQKRSTLPHDRQSIGQDNGIQRTEKVHSESSRKSLKSEKNQGQNTSSNLEGVSKFEAYLKSRAESQEKSSTSKKALSKGSEDIVPSSARSSKDSQNKDTANQLPSNNKTSIPENQQIHSQRTDRSVSSSAKDKNRIVNETDQALESNKSYQDQPQPSKRSHQKQDSARDESRKQQGQPQNSERSLRESKVAAPANTEKEISEEKQILDYVQGAKMASLNLVETLADRDRNPQNLQSSTQNKAKSSKADTQGSAEGSQGKKQSDDFSNEKIEQTTLFYLKKLSDRNKSVQLAPQDMQWDEEEEDIEKPQIQKRPQASASSGPDNLNNNSSRNKQGTTHQIEGKPSSPNVDSGSDHASEHHAESQASIKSLLNTSVSSLKAKAKNDELEQQKEDSQPRFKQDAPASQRSQKLQTSERRDRDLDSAHSLPNQDSNYRHQFENNFDECQATSPENLENELPKKSPQRNSGNNRNLKDNNVDAPVKKSPVKEIKGFDDRLKNLQKEERKDSASATARSSQANNSARTKETPISQRIENKTLAQTQNMRSFEEIKSHGSQSSLNSSISEKAENLNPQTYITSKPSLKNNEQLAANTFGEGRINYQSKSSSYSDLAEAPQVTEEVFVRKSQDFEQKPKRQAPPPRTANQNQFQDSAKGYSDPKDSQNSQRSQKDASYSNDLLTNNDDLRKKTSQDLRSHRQPQPESQSHSHRTNQDRDYQDFAAQDSAQNSQRYQKDVPHANKQEISRKSSQSNSRPTNQNQYQDSQDQRKSHRSQKETPNSENFATSNEKHSSQQLKSHRQPDSHRINQDQEYQDLAEEDSNQRNSDQLGTNNEGMSRKSSQSYSRPSNQNQYQDSQNSQRSQKDTPIQYADDFTTSNQDTNRKSSQKLKSHRQPQSESHSRHQDVIQENPDQRDAENYQQEIPSPNNEHLSRKSSQNQRSQHPQSESQPYFNRVHQNQEYQGFVEEDSHQRKSQKSPKYQKDTPYTNNDDMSRRSSQSYSRPPNQNQYQDSQNSQRSQKDAPIQSADNFATKNQNTNRKSSQNLKSYPQNETQSPSRTSNQNQYQDSQNLQRSQKDAPIQYADNFATKNQDTNKKSSQNLKSYPQNETQSPSRTNNQYQDYQADVKQNSERGNYQNSQKSQKDIPLTYSDDLAANSDGLSRRSSQNLISHPQSHSRSSSQNQIQYQGQNQPQTNHHSKPQSHSHSRSPSQSRAPYQSQAEPQYQSYSRSNSQSQLQPEFHSQIQYQPQVQPQFQSHSRSHSQSQPQYQLQTEPEPQHHKFQSHSRSNSQSQPQPELQSHSRNPSQSQFHSQPPQVQSHSRPQSQSHSRTHSQSQPQHQARYYPQSQMQDFSSDLEAKIQQKLEIKDPKYYQSQAQVQGQMKVGRSIDNRRSETKSNQAKSGNKQSYGGKDTIFKTEVKWNTLYRLREIEDQAARKIQAFYFDRIKKSQKTARAADNEFLNLVETLKKHEKLYLSIKEMLPGQGTDVVNLSIAFISAFCSLKAVKNH